MSLLNQMLRDLEQRAPSNQDSVELDIKVATKPSQSMGLIVIAAAGIALLAAYVSYLHWQSPEPTVIQRRALPIPKPEAPDNPIQQTTIISKQTKETPQPAPASKAKKRPAIPKKTRAKPTKARQSKTSLAIKQPDDKQQAITLYQRAKKLGSSDTGNQLLQQALKLNPMNLQARILLAQNLLQSGLIDETASFLDESLTLFPGHKLFTTTRAQLFLKQHNPTAALGLLTSIHAESSNDATFLSLLAAAYQQQHNYLKSSALYQQLVSQHPESAQHWLGLAIAKDYLGHSQQAKIAYQQALAKNVLKPAIVNYIKQRMTALN